MITILRFRLPALAITFLLLAAAPASAQTAYGTILGSITDPSAEAIPGASVRVTNIGTNISNEVTTGAGGGYAVARLMPGQYRVEVSYEGFKTAASPALALLVNQSLRFDAVLEPGKVETVVEVTAVGTLIETGTSSVGKVVENKQIVDLSMVSRNFTDLIVLSPATVTDSGGALSNPQAYYRTSLAGGASFIGGGGMDDNTYMIAGVENNDPGFQTPSITPPIDAIQEFRLMNKNYSAEFGGGAAQRMDLELPCWLHPAGEAVPRRVLLQCPSHMEQGVGHCLRRLRSRERHLWPAECLRPAGGLRSELLRCDASVRVQRHLGAAVRPGKAIRLRPARGRRFRPWRLAGQHDLPNPIRIPL